MLCLRSVTIKNFTSLITRADSYIFIVPLTFEMTHLTNVAHIFKKIRPSPILALVLLLFSAQVEEFRGISGVAPGDVNFVREGKHRREYRLN